MANSDDNLRFEKLEETVQELLDRVATLEGTDEEVNDDAAE